MSRLMVPSGSGNYLSRILFDLSKNVAATTSSKNLNMHFGQYVFWGEITNTLNKNRIKHHTDEARPYASPEQFGGFNFV